MRKVLFSVVAMSMLGLGISNAVPYDIDKAHSSIDFTIKHLLVSNVNGSFSDFSGVVDIDPKTRVINKLEGEMSIKSIDTRNKDRDSHLMAEKYLDADKFGKATFKMTKFSMLKNGSIAVDANLTIKGVTKKVSFKGMLNGPVSHPMTKKEVFGLQLSATINRKDFNIATDTSSATMGESVNIMINLELSGK